MKALTVGRVALARAAQYRPADPTIGAGSRAWSMPADQARAHIMAMAARAKAEAATDDGWQMQRDAAAAVHAAASLRMALRLIGKI